MSEQGVARARLRRLWGSLRSRRLAIWLLVAISGYLALTTVVHLPSPFSNPVFLIAAGLLTVSTGACAWERTRQTVRIIARARSADESTELHAVARPSFSIAVPDGLTGEDAAVATIEAMRASGLRTYRRGAVIGGSSHSVGHWGSPVFHWALTCLFLFAALGQLTRSEGVLRVVQGASTIDAQASYVAPPQSGLLFLGRYTGARIGVERIDRQHATGGGALDAVPLVVVGGGSTQVRQWVYPNQPARYGSLTIHRNETGPASLVSFRFPNGQEATSVAAFFPVLSEAKSGDRASLRVGTGSAGGGYVIELERMPGAHVVVHVAERGFTSSPLSAGDDVTLPDGTVMRIDKLTSYARLRVVNDWSLPFVFISFCTAILGAALSVFLPPRRALATVGEESAQLHVRVAHRNNDPNFPFVLDRALRTALVTATDRKDLP